MATALFSQRHCTSWCIHCLMVERTNRRCGFLIILIQTQRTFLVSIAGKGFVFERQKSRNPQSKFRTRRCDGSGERLKNPIHLFALTLSKVISEAVCSSVNGSGALNCSPSGVRSPNWLLRAPTFKLFGLPSSLIMVGTESRCVTNDFLGKGKDYSKQPFAGVLRVGSKNQLNKMTGHLTL